VFHKFKGNCSSFLFMVLYMLDKHSPTELHS
jgi:hypothetical protein